MQRALLYVAGVVMTLGGLIIGCSRDRCGGGHHPSGSFGPGAGVQGVPPGSRAGSGTAGTGAQYAPGAGTQYAPHGGDAGDGQSYGDSQTYTTPPGDNGQSYTVPDNGNSPTYTTPAPSSRGFGGSGSRSGGFGGSGSR